MTIDTELLKRQKISLLKILELDIDSNKKEDLEGILNLLDSIGDSIEDEGFIYLKSHYKTFEKPDILFLEYEHDKDELYAQILISHTEESYKELVLLLDRTTKEVKEKYLNEVYDTESVSLPFDKSIDVEFYKKKVFDNSAKADFSKNWCNY